MTTQDLTHAFGRPATASLRGLLPHREESEDRPDDEVALPEPREPADDRPDDEGPTPDEPAPDEGPAPDDALATDEPAGRPARPRRGPSPTLARGRSVARVASRDQTDLLVLLAVRQGPTDGRGVIERVREGSDGALDAPERTVHVTLHRLARTRLLDREVDPRSGRRFYALTEAGERAVRVRLREWQALARGLDGVAQRGGAG